MSKSSKYLRLGFRDDFLIRCESFPGATAWGLGTDNSRWGLSLENTVGQQLIRIVIANLAIAFKDVYDGALSWWYKTKAKVAPLKRL